MSIQERIRYGAAELKAAYNRNLGWALAISVGFHALLIGLYVFGINIGKADDDAKNKLGINKTKLINIAPPPEPPQAAPPPPPPMIPPELMGGSGDGGGVAARAGNPIPVPDAIIAPDVKEFATTTEISVATPEGGTGGGFGPSDGGEGLGTVNIDQPVNITAEAEPDPDDFIPDATEPSVDWVALQKKTVYPEIARKNGIEGKVVVRALIDKTGKPSKYRIDYSDNKLLDANAVDAVMSMQFTPGVQNGVPIPCWVSVPVVFQLD
ncbi:MAG TPA: energy transducer TonB [Candidatus Kapabacteria bacterium]|nr:energy transducer TonB [Candidatus Kapabacteria bacterium]